MRSRDENTRFGLLLLDLDRFKSVNDTLGHSAGDQVLTETARRLTSTFAEAEVLVARLGGDEFAILYSPARGDPRDAEDQQIEDVAGRMLNTVGGLFVSTSTR